jgi:hypothetical protein
VGLTLKAHHGGSDLWAETRLTASRLDPASLMPSPLSGVELRADARLVGMKELWLKDLSLAVPSLATRLQAHGQVLLPGANAEVDGLAASGEVQVQFAAERPITWPAGIVLLGQAGLDLQVGTAGSGVLDGKGSLNFTDLSVEAGLLSLSRMKGSIPVAQRLATRPALGLLAGRAAASGETGDDQEGHDQAVRSKAYDDALRPLKGESRSFTIEQVRFRDLRFSDLSGNLELAHGRLSLESLRFTFLRGDVRAGMSVLFAPPGTRRLALDGELSGIDLSELGAVALAGSSEVAGNLKLQVDLGAREVSSGIHLTQIGQSTFQALLVALDPREVNPGIVKLRSFLDRFKVSPERVTLLLRHGLLSLEAAFQMGLTARAAAGLIEGFQGSTFRLQHLPVGGFLAKYLSF